MTGWRKRTIMDMAQEAGFNVEQGFLLRITGIDEDLERFAKLVREDERDACAKVCDELRDDWLRGLGRYEFMGEGADYCADAIRARGQV